MKTATVIGSMTTALQEKFLRHNHIRREDSITLKMVKYGCKKSGFLIGLLLILTLSVFAADPATVTRDLPSNAAPGSAFTVNLAMDVNDTDPPTSVNVTEEYPTSWPVSHISTGGVDLGDKIVWNCSSLDVCKIVDQDLTYTITVPAGALGTATFQGTVDTETGSYPITGDAEVDIIIPTTTTTTVTTTTILEPAKIVIKRVNDVVCSLLMIIWYIAAAITALIIILGGMRYMGSDDPRETNKAKNIVVYAITGLILIIIACPLINYLIVNTDITPFEDSCPCLIGTSPDVTTTTVSGSTTTTIPGGSTTTTISGATTTLSISTTTTTTSSTTTSSTTTSTIPGPTTDHGICYNAEDNGLCAILNPPWFEAGYEEDCCTEWDCCCTPPSGACVSP
ncbi:MAG: hypothetical protein U9Q22_00085 [Candidatus Altiarchaeota archaeon]|nr:hypothetical protein [Candidatus Altiarchaeota archaeon]